jgi:hypothetical protein
MELAAHSHPRRLVPLLRGYGISNTNSKCIVRKISILLRTQGCQGTFEYLDALSAQFKHKFSKEEIPTKTTWVDFRWWFRRVRKSSKILKMCCAIKRIIVLDKLTPAQCDKFREAVNRPPADSSALQTAKWFITRGCTGMPQFKDSTPSRASKLYINKALSSSKGNAERVIPTAIARMADDLLHCQHMGVLDNEHILSSLRPYTYDTVVGVTNCQKSRTPDRLDYVGNIHVSQEPGAKARFFASPRLIYQAALDGMFRNLNEILYWLSSDCTHDQTRPFDQIIQWLKDSELVLSLDQVDATNNFPVELQEHCMRVLGCHEADLSLVRFLSKASWSPSAQVSAGLGPDPIRWTEGQPLGTKPSFGMFAVTMHALYRGICFSYGIRPNHEFRIGDDFVALWGPPARRLKELLGELGCPISEEKSILSSIVAEFGGSILRDDGVAFRPGKWKSVEDKTFLSYLMDPEFRPEKVFSPQVSKLAQRLRSLPYPYGFLKPDLANLDDDERNKILRLSTKSVLRSQDTSIFGLMNVFNRTFFDSYLRNVAANGEHREAVLAERMLVQVGVAAHQAEDSYFQSAGTPVPNRLDIGHFQSNWQRIPILQQVYASLIATVVMADDLEPLMCHPFIKRMVIERRLREPAQVVSCLIAESPFIVYRDYENSSRGFISHLRRVAEFRDIIPSKLLMA